MRHDPDMTGISLDAPWSDRELWSVAALRSGEPMARSDQLDPHGCGGITKSVPGSADPRPPGASLLTAASLTRAQAALLRAHYLDEVIAHARRVEATLRSRGVPVLSWSVLGVDDLMRAWARNPDTIPLAVVHYRSSTTADGLGVKVIHLCLARSSGTLIVWDPRRILTGDVRPAIRPAPNC